MSKKKNEVKNVIKKKVKIKSKYDDISWRKKKKGRTNKRGIEDVSGKKAKMINEKKQGKNK